MRRSSVAVAGGLAAVLAWATTAGAQDQLNAFGTYPTPLPYNQAPGSYVVGPAAPGSGGTYGYVQQNVGAAMGMSPNAYYSTNYFTATPMSRAYPNAYSSGYAGYPARVNAYTTPNATAYNPVYANANRSYYSNRYAPTYGSTRRGGFFCRLFGR
jgi:hypothetical protein